MHLSKTIHLILIVIIASSWFTDGNGFALAKKRSRTRKLPSLRSQTGQTLKPTRQHWTLSQKTAPLSNYDTKNTRMNLKSAKRNQRPAQRPSKFKKFNYPKPERQDILFDTKTAAQGDWFEPMTFHQYGNQGVYSTIAKVIDIIYYVINLFLNSPYARSSSPHYGSNYEHNFYSPYGTSYDGSYPDELDYNPYLASSEAYDDSQPILAEENGNYETPYNGSIDDGLTGSGGNTPAPSTNIVIGNLVYLFVWTMLNAFWR